MVSCYHLLSIVIIYILSFENLEIGIPIKTKFYLIKDLFSDNIIIK